MKNKDIIIPAHDGFDRELGAKGNAELPPPLTADRMTPKSGPDGRMRRMVDEEITKTSSVFAGYVKRLRNALDLGPLDADARTSSSLAQEITDLVMQYERSSRVKTPALDALCEEAMAALPRRARSEEAAANEIVGKRYGRSAHLCREEELELALTELVGAVCEGPGGHDPSTVSALQEARAVLRKKDWR